MGGGGGSDNSAANQQARQEGAKAAARNAINAQFGVAPTAPDIANYQQPQKNDSGFFFNPLTSFFGTKTMANLDLAGNYLDPHKFDTTYVPDDSAYGQAYKDYQQEQTDAAKNKTARGTVYDTIRTNAYDAGKRGFDETKDNAGRNLKFELFAKGLNSGSVDVDQNAALDRTYKQGLLDLGAKADAAKTDVQSSDEQTRLGLLQSIDAGMDQSSALASAINQLQTNQDRATSQAQGTTLGDLFANSGLLYTNSQRRLGQQNALGQYGSLFPTRAGSSASRGSSGIVTPTG